MGCIAGPILCMITPGELIKGPRGKLIVTKNNGESDGNEQKWVYLFEEGSGDNKALFGGKGAGLCEMTQAGLPVPPGLIVTTEACNAYYDNDKDFPEGMWEQVKEALLEVEKKVGKRFGDSRNPLLVSVRSGAAFSMPGMMDTVLNLGLNEDTVQGLAEQTGDLRFALDAYRRFASLFGEIVMGVTHEKFERVMDRFKAQTSGGRDTDLKAEELREIIAAETEIIIAEQHAIPNNFAWRSKRSLIHGWAAERSTIVVLIAFPTTWERP